jgi:hypothetical protein
MLTGGTAVFTMNEATHQVADKYTDVQGRWAATRLRGKNNIHIRIISAYRCVRNIYGPLSVWNQQRYLLDMQNIPNDPIDEFDRQLINYIKESLESGDHIVLGIDMNDDIRTSAFSKALQQQGLVDICTTKHGNNAPPTYARGSAPIDGIFVSKSLLRSASGYLPIACDHRVLWIDIPYALAFGRSLKFIPQPQPKRLTLQDPRVVKKYNANLYTFLKESSFLEKVKALESKFVHQNRAKSISEYNILDNMRTQGILQANHHCRHLKMGTVPFSPTIARAWKTIHAWTLLRHKLQGRRVNSRYLSRVLKQAGISRELLTLQAVEESLTAAWSHYKILKKQATYLRSTWVEEVAAAKAEAGNTSAAQELKNLLSREKQRRNARIIKYVIANQERRG